MQPPTERITVFYLPGLGGREDPELETFFAPSRALFDLVPLTYLDWKQIAEADCDFNVFAAHVTRQIEIRMPSGPIRIAGYSMGGHLAFAAARGFEQRGRVVAALVILDSPANAIYFTSTLRRRIAVRIKRLLAFDFRSGLASVLAKILILRRARPLLRWLARYRDTLLPWSFDQYLHHKITMQLVRRLFPPWWQSVGPLGPPLAAPAFIFRSEEHEPCEREDLGWNEYCLDVRVIPVAGSHRGMLDPTKNRSMREAFVETMASPASQPPVQVAAAAPVSYRGRSIETNSIETKRTRSFSVQEPTLTGKKKP